MEDNKYTRNILILLIGVASIVLALMFANITYQLSNKRAEAKKSDSLSVEAGAGQLAADSTTASAAELYETCVMISTDKNIVLNNKELMSLNGFPVKIKESKRANKLIYSLIIDKQLTREDAILLGEEIKDKYDEIHSYWIEKISDGKSEEISEEFLAEETTEPEISKDVEEKPLTPPVRPDVIRYEIQIMANTELEKIETTKQFLESEGYKLKVIEFNKDGTTYYRLRLVDPYSKAEADLVGSKLKKNYKFINSYWLDKIVE